MPLVAGGWCLGVTLTLGLGAMTGWAGLGSGLGLTAVLGAALGGGGRGGASSSSDDTSEIIRVKT